MRDSPTLTYFINYHYSTYAKFLCKIQQRLKPKTNLLDSWLHVDNSLSQSHKFSFFFWSHFKVYIFFHTISIHSRDGNGAGQGQRMGSSPPPRMDFSCPIPALPRMTGKISCPIPAPKGPMKTFKGPPYLVKLYFLSIFPTTITIFSNKMTYFNNKNIL